MYYNIEKIDPEKAREYLKNNDGNRNVSQSTVRKYAHDMKNGNWESNGVPIFIASDGELKDGQHRLLAVILANTTVEMVVCHDSPKDAVIYDRGRTRTTSNILQMLGYKSPYTNNTVVGAVKLLLDRYGYRNVTDATVKTFVDTFSEQLFSASTFVGSSGMIMRNSPSVAAVAVAAYSGINEEVLKTF